MNMSELFSRLNRQGIKLQIDVDDLKINVPKSKLTPDLLKELREKKEEIINLLQNYVQKQEKFISIESTERREYYVLSSAQNRLYFLQQMSLDSNAYNIPVIIPLLEDVHIEKLEEGFKKLIKRHESLRTSFHMVNDTPVQVVHDEVEFEIEYYNLTTNYTEKKNYKIQNTNYKQNTNHKLQIPNKEVPFGQILNASGETTTHTKELPPALTRDTNTIIKSFIRPFDLSKAPLLRVGLLKTGGGHLLLADMHHIVSDGVSHAILVKDFLALHEGEDLLPLRVQYKDFSQWQNGEKEKENLKQQGKYWLKEFEGEIPVLELSADYPRPLEQSFEGNSINFEITEEETRALKAMALSEGFTLFMVLVAFYNILLSKLSGQEEIIIGTPIAGRRHADLEKIIGMFVNTLSLRNYPSGDRTVKEFLGEVKEKTLIAFENQDYPFEELVDKLSVKRDIGRNPLFDIMFVLQNMNTGAAGQDEETEIEISRPVRPDSPKEYENIFQTAKFDLTLTAMERGNGLFLSFQYCTKLFKKETIERFILYFKKIVSIAVKEPGIRVSEIVVISEEEKNRILYDFNDTETGYPKDKTIHQLFEEQAERTPYNIAVVGLSVGAIHESHWHELSQQISYRKLSEESHGLAISLKKKGVEPDTIVGIKMERSVEMIIGILAILKAGGAYLPIDPDYPKDRIDFMLRDSGVKILATSDEIKDRLFPSNLTLTGTLSHVSSTNLAYVIYTSGTTGQPKGALLEHKNVVRLLFNDRFKFDFNETDVWSLFHSFGFDFSVWEMYGSLLYGGRLVVVLRMTSRDPRQFLEILKDHQVTVLNQTPSAFYNLIDEELKSSKKDCCLRYVIFGGETLKPSKLKEFREKYPGTKLVNMFGITETCVHVTYKEIGELEIQGDISNIGKPIATLTTFIMDRYPKLLPVGVPGELYVGGEGVARGYLNRPELSKDRFIENPYKEGDRLYRSGDKVKLCADGEMVYLGRLDHQVQLRGFRIELGEIENRLLKYETVKEAVVIDRTTASGDLYLCAYIVPKTSMEAGGLNSHALREFLSNQLPYYMIPTNYVKLEKIPVNANGKINRNALPDPVGREEISLRDVVDYIPPASAVEKKLVEIWEKVLGRDNIGINESFFMIGGDSIKSIQIISRVSSAGYKLEMKDLFQYPVISDLAPLVKKLKRIPDQSTITGTIPLTPIQEDFFNKSHIDSHHYNQAVMFYSKDGFDEGGIKAVFTKIQEHHDALRMTYKLNIENGKIVQITHGLDYPLSIDEYDLKNRENNLEEFKAKLNEIQASIDLEKGPLMKLGLFHMDDGDRLLIAVHHLVIDGVSWRILFEDIDTLYRQYKRGEKLVLPSKTDSFKLWSEQLSEYANSKKFLKEKTYWQKIESVEAPPIPKDFEVDDNYIKDSVSVSFTLGEEETGLLLTKVNEIFRTEINDILLTALGMGIKKAIGHDRICIALEGHGREEILEGIDISRTVGWFTSVYPVLIDVSYPGDLGRQIKEIKETLRRIPNKGIGYGIIKYLTGEGNKKESEFKINPPISFNYLGQFDADVKQISSFEIAGESAGNTQSLKNRREYLLDISGMTAGNRLTMNVSYIKTHFKPGTIAVLVSGFESELKNLITFCCSRDKIELTPADFTYKGLSIESIDRLTELYPGLEDLYTLTPMQEGMLFHALVDEVSPLYFEQMSYRLEGELDICLVEKSLNELFKRHDILRTAFVYQDIERPVQVVLKDRAVDFYYEDISNTGEREEKENFIREFKTSDIKRSFALNKGVLMRVLILKTEESQYEFIWSFHHVLMDGWCIGIINNEFFEIYTGYLENRPYRLPVLKPYRTYIQWLGKQDRESSAKYWENYLDSYEEQTGVPKTKIYKEVNEPGYRNETVSFVLDMEKTAGLNKLAGRNHVTLNTVTRALWGVLLGRYNGKEDVVFGAVVSGRPSGLEGVESMVGLFINTIPVRIQFNKVTKFSKLLQNVQKEAIASEPYHYHPLAEIQAGTTLKQNLIDHIMVFENYPIAEQIEGFGREKNESNKISIKLANVEVFEQTNYDFNVVLGGSDRLRITFQYNGNVYDKEFVERMANHFSLAFDQVIENQELKVRELTLLSEEEKNRILYEFNNTETEYPKDKTIHQLFEEQVERTPDHVALVGTKEEVKTRRCAEAKEEEVPFGRINAFGEAGLRAKSQELISVTYKELNYKANQLAHLLIEKGVQPDTIVGIMVERSIEMIVGILGILKSGGAYLPIDPDYPQERIDYMLKDSGAKLLVTTENKEGGKVRRWEGEIFYIQESLYSSYPLTFLPSYLQSSSNPATSLAYVIYTSGTTGKPKGVLVEHRNAANTVSWFVDIHKVGTGTRILQLSDYTFDASVNQIFGSLNSGASLYIAAKEIRADIKKLRDYIIYHRINIINFVPTLLKELLCYVDKLESLHIVLSGAEKLDEATKEVIIGKGYRLFNQYGPTETAIDALAMECSSEKVSLGKPISNVVVYILDKYENILPIGVVGELYITGAGVARGYLNRPELTAERFISFAHELQELQEYKNTLEQARLLPTHSSPLTTHQSLITNQYLPEGHLPLRAKSQEPGAKLYKTGDLARWLSDGNIEFLGRIDHQVKIRGYRIELGEIENCLLKVSGVKEAVVVVREEVRDNRYISAYLVSDREYGISELRESLSKELPNYMIPSYFFKIKRIPLTSNGKIDMKALGKMGEVLSTVTAYSLPSTEIEKIIADIWKEILDMEKVSIYDNFFEFGGNSLTAIILTSRIKKIGFNITLLDIIKNPTIHMLTSIITGKNVPEKSAEDLYEESLLGNLECIEKLNKGRNERNIFIIHAGHGMVNQYKEFAVLLEQDYNVYGVQASGLKPGSKMSETPEQMVNDYLEQILAVQKDGHYIIAGYCTGTLIGYEIVRKLESLNRSVEKLILFDSSVFFTDRFVMILRTLGYLPDFVKRVILFSNDRRFKKAMRIHNATKIGVNDGEEITGENDLRKEKITKHMRVLGAHILPLELIKAPIIVPLAENTNHLRAAEENFNRMTKSKATVIRTPGDHNSIWERPYVEKLAEVIINNL